MPSGRVQAGGLDAVSSDVGPEARVCGRGVTVFSYMRGNNGVFDYSASLTQGAVAFRIHDAGAEGGILVSPLTQEDAKKVAAHAELVT